MLCQESAWISNNVTIGQTNKELLLELLYQIIVDKFIQLNNYMFHG